MAGRSTWRIESFAWLEGGIAVNLKCGVRVQTIELTSSGELQGCPITRDDILRRLREELGNRHNSQEPFASIYGLIGEEITI
jgi:hypothetical protein